MAEEKYLPEIQQARIIVAWKRCERMRNEKSFIRKIYMHETR